MHVSLYIDSILSSWLLTSIIGRTIACTHSRLETGRPAICLRLVIGVALRRMILYTRRPSGIVSTGVCIMRRLEWQCCLKLEFEGSKEGESMSRRCRSRAVLKIDNGGRPFPIEFHAAHGTQYASIEFPDACTFCVRLDERIGECAELMSQEQSPASKDAVGATTRPCGPFQGVSH